MSSDLIERRIDLPIAVNKAFDLFVAGFQTWWPAEYTWSKDTLQRIVIDPGQGAPCFEEGPHGFRCQWGRVLTWEPPQRISFSWQIAPDRTPEPNPRKASEVTVIFTELQSGGTRVRLIHSGFARHGEGAAAYKEELAAPEGWPYLLGRLAKRAEEHR
jgi:uncharacterized protein YndB with AHSA1/START domain